MNNNNNTISIRTTDSHTQFQLLSKIVRVRVIQSYRGNTKTYKPLLMIMAGQIRCKAIQHVKL